MALVNTDSNAVEAIERVYSLLSTFTPLPPMILTHSNDFVEM